MNILRTLLSGAITGVVIYAMLARPYPDIERVIIQVVFALITAILVAILVVMAIVRPRTDMQRGWLYKVIAFNLVVWRTWLLRAQGWDALPGDVAIIFWLVVLGFLLAFARAFTRTWIVPMVKGVWHGSRR